MVYIFCAINEVTIKIYYLIRRIEPILKTLLQRQVKVFFKSDTSNGYQAYLLNLDHAWKVAFITTIRIFYYLRIGQGLTGVYRIYVRLKDIIIGSIPAPNLELGLNKAIPSKACFGYFVDDNIGIVDTTQDMIEFLYIYYLLRLVQARLTLNLKKCFFLTTRIKILGHDKTTIGIRLSEDKLRVFK